MIPPVLGLCIAASAGQAQEEEAHSRMWGAIGIGGGMPTSGGDGIANMAQLVYQKRSHHIAIRGLVLHDLERSTKEIGEVGALYGRTNLLQWGHVALAAGLSAVAFDTCPDDDDSCFTLGAPIVAEAALTRRFAGLGLQAFGNINSKAVYAGAAIFLQLGRFR